YLLIPRFSVRFRARALTTRRVNDVLIATENARMGCSSLTNDRLLLEQSFAVVVDSRYLPALLGPWAQHPATVRWEQHTSRALPARLEPPRRSVLCRRSPDPCRPQRRSKPGHQGAARDR